MPSPFPGMDPHLEGYLWPDVHHALATEIRRRLTPAVRPRYVVRLEVSVVEDETPEAEIGIMYPDIEVISSDRHGSWPTSGKADDAESSRLSAQLTIPFVRPVEARLASVEIRDTARNEL